MVRKILLFFSAVSVLFVFISLYFAIPAYIAQDFSVHSSSKSQTINAPITKTLNYLSMDEGNQVKTINLEVSFDNSENQKIRINDMIETTLDSEITATNSPPVASFTETAETAYTGEVITFNASDSYDPDGNITSYEWDFGDGTNATGEIVDHAYVDDGVYNVTLTVTDNNGSTSSATATKTILNRSPIASFTESAETAYTNEIIAFNASASYDPDGNITSYFWDFGDGTNATGVYVEHAYADNGNYTVTLTVTDDDGANATASATKTILNQSPVASFTESAETVYTGETITFNASGSYDADGTITSYLWDFGDGTNATGIIVDHAYTDNGNYTVTLTVTDDDGATTTVTSTKTVLNRPPVASFTESAETVLTGETITFNATNSYDPDGSIVSYFWDFGDGSNATGVVVDHSYADDGNYTVTLTVTDDDGATSVSTSTKTIMNRPPIASFTESTETAYTGETISFNASASYDPDGFIVSYFWDFGDGTNATGVTVSHSYADNGTYVVTLRVVDDDGAESTTSSTKTILNTAPVAAFTESAETVYTNEIITFNASSSYDSDGSIVSYFWDFGDGTNATGVVVEHAYSDNGNYTVTLTVTDDDGATATSTSIKNVLNRPPIATFTESAETVYTGEAITFNASGSYDPDGSIVSYFWDFGDGTNATGVVVTHSYSDDGNYTVTLTVTDDDGASSLSSATKNILNRSPVASFTESAESVLTGETIYFNASESYDPDGSIVSYFWDFGDGTNATGVVVEHAYADDGNYTVTLTVTDDDGATASATATKSVSNRPPVASFTESAQTVYTDEIIVFNASSSYDSDGSIVSYFWDFGDGSNATGVTVEHSYAEDGNYTVTLTITDDDGATSSTTATKEVLNRPPIASFTESAQTIFTNETISFNASASYDPDGFIVSYFWDFGDGTNATGVTVEHTYVENGNYTVTLTVTDDDGATTSTSAVKTVENRLPVASFTETAETVYTGEVITFDASASYDPDGNITSYFWDFGDGTNLTGAVVGHAYADDGNYTVTLTVTDDDGATSTASAIKTILNRPPVADFTVSATVVPTGKVISFNASDSYDKDGVIVSYFWDFGDGTNATGVYVEHAYADNGTYVVTLTVTDDDGATGIATVTIEVLNRPPVASFTESAETASTTDIIAFNASASYDPDGNITSYFWDFGDGTNATGMYVEHRYSTNGTFTVTLTITDDDGDTDSSSSTKTISWNDPPIASFTESSETVYTGDIIAFNASASYDPDGNITSYFWDFGDGTNATGVYVKHAYADDGNYTVTLTVTDDDGATSSATSSKTILNRAPVASFTESAETVYTGEVISFNASGSYDPDGSIVSYFWDFGDGSNATGVTVEHSYAEDGNYTVTLTITDDDGAIASTTSIKTVLNRPPMASFTYSPDFPIVGENVTFDASSSYDSDGTIVSYTWDFGDGNTVTSTSPMVTHIYTVEGNYTVTLTVTDNDNASGITDNIIRIRNYPTAAFTYSPEYPGKGQTVTFNASISTANGGTIVNYTWTFGDGTNATVTDPVVTHVYEAVGNYTVTLTVTDSEGLSDSQSKILDVGIAPIASFTYSPTNPFAGETVTFNASASYDSDGYIANYTWDFGDGNTTTVTDPVIIHAYAVGGNYTVTLTVTDNERRYNATSDIVSVRDYPSANFTWSPSYPIVNETTTFNASSSMPNGGVILYYLWDFGDGSPLLNTTDPITTHVYTAVGNYTVTLTVGDSEGLNDTISKTVKLRAYPTAEFTWSPETPIATEQVTFNATLSEANSGNITEYVWDFGDGTVVGTNYPIKKHTYSSAGNYSVTLTIKNSEGLSSSITKVITVLNAPPVASFGYSPDFPLANETVTFNASLSYDPDGTIVSYTWDFGDGNTTSTANTIIYHAYASPGNYTVNLTVMDDASATASTTKTIKIVAYPTAEFTWSPSPQEVSKPVTFNATMSKANSGVIVSYTWDFGDGNTTSTTDPIIIHTYAASGNYTVTLTVKNSDELSSNITKVVTILPSPPEANFYWEPTFPLVNQTVTFNASSSEPNGGIIKLYEWDFGDGTPIRQSITDTITHTYTAYGEYNVTLRVTDTEDLSDTVSKIVVVIAPPTADFEWSPEAPKTYETITFNASASSPNGGTITSYTWDFGDGNTTTVANPIITHYYETAGNYTVTLNVTDSEGLWATMVKEISIEAAPQPQAFFEYSPDQPYVFEEIIFNASTSTTSVGTITDYVWDFGDGNTTTTTDPIITYSYDLEGNYTVTLTILTSIGQNATTSKLITILPICGPTAEFTWSPLLPRYNQTVTFNASASTPGWNGTTHPPIVYYVWDFGDGNTTTTTDPIIYYVYTQDGNYTVTLTVIDVNGDNSTITKTITVTVLIGDVNGDGKVDIMDIAIVAKAYGSYPGMDNWNPDADVNGDGKVDIMDIAIVAKHYGEGV